MTIAPTAPQRFVSALPGSFFGSGTTYAVHSGNDLQAVLAGAVPGDTIVMDNGATFTGPFFTPNSNYATGWITIISSAEASLPRPGTRVSLADAANMPTIQSVDSQSAFVVPDGSHGIRCVGIRFLANPSNFTYFLVWLGRGNVGGNNRHSDYVSGSYQLSVNSDTQVGETTVSNRISMERCIVTAADTKDLQQGIRLDCRDARIQDCYIEKCHHRFVEAQAIAGGDGPGPYLIDNNYIEGAGENIMFGGRDSTVQNMTPSDIIFTHNYCFKPKTWNPSDGSYANIPWDVKNLFELKHAQRVLVRGNVFENCWVSAQTGDAILLDNFNQEGTNTWSKVWDVDFRHNEIIGYTGAGWFSWNGSNAGGLGPTVGVKRVHIFNCLFRGVAGSGSEGFSLTSTTADPITDFWIEHVTNWPCNKLLGLFSPGSGGALFPRLTLQNCIFGFGSYGPQVDTVGAMTNAVANDVASDREFAIIEMLNLGDTDGSGPVRNNGSYATGFVSCGGDATTWLFNTTTGVLGDASGLKGVGTDGKDPGVDFVALNIEISQTVSGIPPAPPALPIALAVDAALI